VDIDHFAFAAFSLGERSCIGRNFARIELLTTLAVSGRKASATGALADTCSPALKMLIQKYEIRVPEGVPREKLMDATNRLTLAPAYDGPLLFHPRAAPART
jgi:hypothetical protein